MKRLIMFLPIVFLLFTSYSLAQWERMKSAPSGNSNAMYETEDRIYVNSEYDIYYAENNGEYQWNLITPPKEYIFSSINDIIEVDNTIYVATSKGLYYTSNEGEEWQLETFNGISNDTLPYIYELEYTNNTLFAIAYSDVFISKDNGSSWTIMNIMDSTSISHTSMTTKDSIVVLTFGGTSYPPTAGSCIWLSYDYGENWEDITTADLPYRKVLDEIIVDTTVFISTPEGIFKSSIYNIQWEYVSIGYGYCYLLSYDGTIIYGLTPTYNFMYSEDNGLTWVQGIAEEISPIQFKSMNMFQNKGNVILMTGSGLIKTSDLGINWTVANDGFCSLTGTNLEVKGSELFLSNWRRGVFSSTDWGNTWRNMNKSTYSLERHIWSMCKTDEALYTGGYTSAPMRVTKDNGETWNKFSNKLPNGHYKFIKEYNDYLFISYSINSNYFFVRATKDGSVIDTIEYNNSIELYASDFISANEGLYISAYTDGVLYSEDEGITWQSISKELVDIDFYSLAYSDGTLFAGTNSGNIYSTSDIGQNWKLFYEAKSDSSNVALMQIKDDNLFFINKLNGKYYTIEYINSVRACNANSLNVIKTNGEYHADISFNVVSRRFMDVVFKEDTLIASAARGIYKMPISEIERLSVDEEIRGDYLYACPPYPTPADQEVNVKIYWDAVLGLEYADMGVYDLVGNRICGKDGLQINRTGSWNAIVTWNSSGEVPGVYFLIVKHGMKSKCIKFLIK